MDKSIIEILDYFPRRIKEKLIEYANFLNQTQEIHVYTNRHILLRTSLKEIKVDYIVNTNEILEILQRICDNSIYTYQSQICNGYITIKGGNRVGIVGSGVIENGQVINVNYISSLNFRIARQKIGCSNQLIENLIDLKKGSIYNTLIISPPRRRKNNIIKRYN